MKWISRSEVRLTVQCSSLLDQESPHFEVGCCHYSPEVDDIIQRKWGPSTDQVLMIPTYCAVDLTALRSELPTVVEKYREYQLLKFHQTGETGQFPKIVIATLEIATRHEVSTLVLRIK